MKSITLVLALFTFCFCASQAQDLPNDLTAISQADAPPFATYYSIAYWPDYPPLPWNAWDSTADLYYSPTYGTSYIWVDDRATVAGRMLTESDDPPPVPGGDGGGSDPGFPPEPMYDYEHDFTNLWLSVSYITNVIEGVTNLQAAVVMHNTTNINGPYEIFSTTNLATPMSNWISEGIWIAHATNTPANIDVGDRTNQNFFRARLWNGQFTYGIPKCGELFLLLPDTNAIYAIVNGVTNPVSPFYSNWAMARLPATNGNILQTYNFNAGYDGSDSGPDFISPFTNQNIRAFLGFSAAATNVALSYNAITNIDVRSWPKLYDLECWHCTNLLSAKITGCPQLHRICFESLEDGMHGIQGTLDFTGSTNLADVRCAQNAFTNIIFGGAGPKIFHLCTRDLHNGNSPRLPNIDFSQFPSMKELWVWRDASFVQPLVLTHTNCPQLTSAQAYGNFFYAADFGGQTNLDNVLLSGTTPATLTNINIVGCTKLRQVEVIAQSLSTYWVDSILTNLDKMGYHGNSIDDGFEVQVQGNDRPSVEGYRAVSNLVAKLWTVNVAPLASGTPLIPSISVTGITSNSATINWTTDIASDSAVYYGTTTDFGLSASDGSLVTSHSITLTGLSIDTTYYYYVHSTASGKTGTSGNHQFNTLPPPPPPNTNAIWFTNNSATVSMQVFAPAATSITWVWGNGTVTTNVTSITTNLGSTSLSNAVVVDPATALLGFGASCGNSYSVSNTLLKSVWGLTNYPNLGSLYLLSTYVSDLSLAKCTNLTHLALIHTAPSTNTENAWFHDLATAQAAGKPSCSVVPLCDGSGSCNNFYCPLNPGPTNTAPGSDYSILQGLGWTITPLN